ncbi:acyl-CoA dehydrogenase family protein [Mycobacterium sp. E2327]|uniref:acyl-CoA dehydrogenase family protein n=1 Tax=Mycobacterium sp. E2327 TaxID=1834132 RepID=UPI000ADD4767|nr:acyl-CoA dehydrogenase family protein [Mycobacterium sp. E2327]
MTATNEILSPAVEVDEALIEAAEALIPQLAARADDAERQAGLPQTTIGELDDLGIRRMALPKSVGGLEASPRTIVAVTEALARGCASTSFINTVYTAAAYLICQLPDPGWQAFTSSDNPTSTITVNPGGKAVREGNGYRIAGKWPFGTGQQYSGWSFVAALIDGPGDIPDAGFFLVPRHELTALDDWNVTGLCGTASNTLAGENIYVPEERVLRIGDFLAGRSDSSLVRDNPYYQHPAAAFTLACLPGTPLGVVAAALEVFRSRVGKRGITYTSYLRQADAALTHHQIDTATMKLDQARFHAERLADTASRRASDLDLETRARCRADTGWTVRLCREAADVIQAASGASAIHRKDALQRMMRDMQVISVHSLLLPTTNSEVYGRVLCGLDPDTAFL